MLPAERRQIILERLARQGRVTVAELSRELGVSPMTVHRDLDALATQGRLRKVRGGAVPLSHEEFLCPVCGGKPRARVRMVLHLADGTTWWACCPHCGLLGVALHSDKVITAVVPDFLTSQVMSAHQATFLVGPDVRLCCTPTVLAFQHRRDAERFRRGFGGQVASLEEAVALLQALMSSTAQKGEGVESGKTSPEKRRKRP